MAKNIH